MPERRIANIAFALLLTVCLFAFAKPTVSAAPLQWHDLGNYREAKVNRSVGQALGFLLLSAKAAGDVDGDGLCDLYLCSLDGDNGLFKNLGDWKFRNITAVAEVGAQEMSSTGAAFGDLDGDGDLDIYVANYGETSVLRSGGSVSVRTINGKQVVTGRYANRIRIMGGSKDPARLGSGSSGRYSRNSDTQILGATGRIRSSRSLGQAESSPWNRSPTQPSCWS